MNHTHAHTILVLFIKFSGQVTALSTISKLKTSFPFIFDIKVIAILWTVSTCSALLLPHKLPTSHPSIPSHEKPRSFTSGSAVSWSVGEAFFPMTNRSLSRDGAL